MRGTKYEGWVKRDGALEDFLPRDAPSVVSSSLGAAWNWSAYKQIIAATPNDFIPHALQMKIRAGPLAAGLLDVIYEFELAIGAAAAEVTYSRHTGGLIGLTANGIVAYGSTIPLGPTVIPAGTRVSSRVRISRAIAQFGLDASCYIAGYDQFSPVAYAPYQLSPYLNGVNAAQTLSTPSGSTLSITPGNRPAYGAWVQVIAAASQDLLVWGASWFMSALTDRSLILELGTGAGASEVPRARVGFPAGGLVMNAGTQWLRRPVFVKKGERLAARSSGLVAAVDHQFFYELL